MIRHLADSDHYRVTSEYESAMLHLKKDTSGRSIYLGDFYGDPDCAIISLDEKYLVVGGEGLIIYRLKEPFSDYDNRDQTEQYTVLFKNSDNLWWISNLHQSDKDKKYFRFVAAHDSGEFTYRMNADDLTYEQF